MQVRLFVLSLFLAIFAALTFSATTNAQTRILPTLSPSPSPVSSPSPSPEPTPTPRTDITQTQTGTSPLQKILEDQEIGSVWPYNPIKYAIRQSVNAGVPPNTIVLLLLLTVVASVIAAARHIIGLRGFGIFLPAALSVVFVATGPVVGIAMFMIIVAITIFMRVLLRTFKVKLQYLPRMALMLLFVVLGVLAVLFAAPFIRSPNLTNVSIFPVLILVLLAEDFTKVQLGKSAKTAINITTETLILALVSYIFLTLKPLQEFALLNPEILIISVAGFDILVGKYVGLRFAELWRFRKIISG